MKSREKIVATTLELSSLNADSPYIKKIVKALIKAVGQEIPIVTPLKVKRIAGVSCKGFDFVFLGGQKLTLFVRMQADVIRAKLNDKDFVLSGDFSNDFQTTFDNGVNSVAKLIRNNQKKFETDQSKQKISAPTPKRTTTTPSQTPTKQLAALQDQDSQLQAEIDKKTATIAELEDQLKSL